MVVNSVEVLIILIYIRSLVLNHYKPDVIGVVESWLHGDEEASFEGCKWFGNNRKAQESSSWFWWGRGRGAFGRVSCWTVMLKTYCG